MRVGITAVVRSAGWCAAALLATAIAYAPAASAEPETAPPPAPTVTDIVAPAAPTDPGSTPLAAPLPVDAVPPAQGVPHLPSLDNLPPGTTDQPTGRPQGRSMGYLRELWHAVQTQDVQMGDALLLFTQRPLDPDATPPAGLAAGPQQPVAQAAPPALPVG
jgi:hypothetical protein